MFRVRRLVALLALAAVAAVVPLAPASASSDLDRLLTTAEAEGWGPAEWAWFEWWANLARLAELNERATAGDRDAWHALVWLVFDHDAPGALAVSWRESRWDARAINERGCYEAGITWRCFGGFQQHGRYVDGRLAAAGYGPEARMDALAQIVTAHHLFVQSGRSWCPHWCF